MESQSVGDIQGRHFLSANEVFTGGEVIVTVVFVTPGRLLTYWNMMRADSQGGKIAPDSHLLIYHLQARQFEVLQHNEPMSHRCNLRIFLSDQSISSLKLADESHLIKMCILILMHMPSFVLSNAETKV